MSDTKRKSIKQFIPWVDALAGAFGKNCEVVLHDFSNLDKSIVKIANGHITGRDIGGPITDMGLRLFEEIKGNNQNIAVIGYRTKTKDGRELRSTTIFIKDEDGTAAGCLCINIDLTPYLSTKSLLDQMCETESHHVADWENDSPEKFATDVDSLIGQLIERAMFNIKKPAASLSKEDKLQVLRDLKQSGFFLIKGSVKRLSKELGVSLPTIYKYLEAL